MPIPLIPAIAAGTPAISTALSALGTAAMGVPTVAYLVDHAEDIKPYANKILTSLSDDIASIIKPTTIPLTKAQYDAIQSNKSKSRDKGDIQYRTLPYEEVISRTTPPSGRIQLDLSRTMDSRLGDAVSVLTGKATVTNNTPSTSNTPENETEDNKPQDNKPQDNKPQDNKPQDNKPQDNKPQDNKPQDNKPNENLNKPKKNLKERIKEWRDSEIKWTAPTSSAGKLFLRALPYIGEWYPIAEGGSQIGKKLNWNEDSLTQNIIDLLKRDEKPTQKTITVVPIENASQFETQVSRPW